MSTETYTLRTNSRDASGNSYKYQNKLKLNSFLGRKIAFKIIPYTKVYLKDLIASAETNQIEQSQFTPDPKLTSKTYTNRSVTLSKNTGVFGTFSFMFLT